MLCEWPAKFRAARSTSTKISSEWAGSITIDPVLLGLEVVPGPQQGVDNGSRHGLRRCRLRLEEVLVHDVRRPGELVQKQQPCQGNAAGRSHCSRYRHAAVRSGIRQERVGKVAGSRGEGALFILMLCGSKGFGAARRVFFFSIKHSLELTGWATWRASHI